MKRTLKKILFGIYAAIVCIIGACGLYILFVASGCESGTYCG
jgi:hypothetical protein